MHFSNGSVPPNAVVAGHDSDGDTIYVGRAFFSNDMLPAKVIPNKGKAYVAYAREEHELENYEVLSGYNYEWLSAENGRCRRAPSKLVGMWTASICMRAGVIMPAA